MEEVRYRDWLSLSLRLLWCYDDRLMARPSARRPRTARMVHANSGAWLVLRGWARVEHEGCSLRAEEGQWLVVRPVRRVQEFPEDVALLSVAFEAVWPDGSHWLDQGLSTVLDADEFPELEESAAAMAAIASRIAPDTWDIREHAVGPGEFLRLEGGFALWLSRLTEALATRGVAPAHPSQIDSRVLHALRILHGMPLSRRPSLADTARAVGVSAVHLDRLFRQCLQTTFNGYTVRLRLRHCCTRLRMPDVRVGEVASEVAFCDVAAFSHWFRRQTGMSPREYRRVNGYSPRTGGA